MAGSVSLASSRRIRCRASCRSALDAGARIAIGPDDQPFALRRGERCRLARPVGVEEGGEARYHRRIARDQQEVAGAREALRGVVERRDRAPPARRRPRISRDTSRARRNGGPRCRARPASRTPDRDRAPPALARAVTIALTATPRADAPASACSTRASSHRKIDSTRRRRAARMTPSTARRRPAGSMTRRSRRGGHHSSRFRAGSHVMARRPAAPPAIRSPLSASSESAAGAVAT